MSVEFNGWICPLCGEAETASGLLPERCEIKELSVGEECLAYRQIEQARVAHTLSIDRMHPQAFEELLAEKLAIARNDVYPDDGLSAPIGNPTHILNALPARPDAVLKTLGLSQSQLLELVRVGGVPAPARFGHGRVAWRRDEIEALGSTVR